MELSLSQLRGITLGALDVRREDGIRFCRLTDSQLDAFVSIRPTWWSKCHALAGIRLDFYTDSSMLALRWHKALVTTRKICFADVLVDGVLMMHCGTADCTDAPEGGFCMALPEGTHRIQIFLPTLVGVWIQSVQLSDGASLIPAKPARRILIHGDSISQGYDAHFPSACYANRLALHYDAEIVNQAIGAAGFQPEVLENVGDFDCILVAYGTNDWSKKTLEQFHVNCRDFMEKLKKLYPQTPVLVLLPIWRADIPRRQDVAGDYMQCRQMIAELASRQGFTVLDDFDLLPHDTRLFSDAYLHPSDVGFALYTRRLIELIDETGVLSQ